MTWTYSFAADTPKDLVRLLIPDKDWQAPIFEDEEIGAFLTLEGQNVRRATAAALETIASSEALVLKVMTLGDLTTDGAKLATELRARATELRTLADKQTDDTDLWDTAEVGWTVPAQRDIYQNALMRSGV